MTTILSVSSISLLDQIGLWFIVIGGFVIFVCVMIWTGDCAKQAEKKYGGGPHPVWSRYESESGLVALLRALLIANSDPEPEPPKPLTKRQQRQRERMIRKRRERVRKYRERQALEQERLKNQESES